VEAAEVMRFDREICCALLATAMLCMPQEGAAAESARADLEIPPVVVVLGFGAPTLAEQTVRRVLVDDLQRSLLLSAEAGSPFLDETRYPSAAEPALAHANYVVTGAVRSGPDGKIDVRFRLWKLPAAEQLGGMSYNISAEDIRLAGHRIADLVHQRVTGVTGDYSARLALIEVREDRYLLLIADSDGHDARQALSSPKPLLMPIWSGLDGRVDRAGSRLAYLSFELGDKPDLWIQDTGTGRRARQQNAEVMEACAGEINAFIGAESGKRARWFTTAWMTHSPECAAAMSKALK
jgi:hypothetical protein